MKPQLESITQNFVGTTEYPDFVVSARHFNADNNIFLVNTMEEILNENLLLENYSSEKIKHITYIYIVYPQRINQAQWVERKYYKAKERKYFIDIKVPDYERFCSAEKTEVLQIMAEQTLRGSQLFLSKEKDFDFPKFYTDLSELFHKQGWV